MTRSKVVYIPRVQLANNLQRSGHRTDGRWDCVVFERRQPYRTDKHSVGRPVDCGWTRRPVIPESNEKIPSSKEK